MILEDSQATGQNNSSATCSRLENTCSKCRDGAINTIVTEEQLKPYFLKGEPKEQLLTPIGRLENN